MSRNLSKIKEVVTYTDSNFVNKELKTGKWIILEIKVVETAVWQEETHMRKAYIRKFFETLYVLGRVK